MVICMACHACVEDAARKVGERFASRKSAFGEQGDITAEAAVQIVRARA